MPFITNFVRAKSSILFALVATIICSALSASLFFNRPSHAAVREDLGSESVQVFAGDCRTPQTTFFLGDTVCVRVGEFPLHPSVADYYRRINWSAPNLNVAETQYVKGDPQYDTFVIPTFGEFAQPGRWRVQTVDIETNARSYANFMVRHPRVFLTDLRIWKQGPDFILPGDRIRYELTIRNGGPEFAEYVQFAEDVPTNATFLALKQTSGSFFECQTPKQGDIGRILCTGKGLRLDEEATFDIYYVVNERVREGDFCEGLTQIASQTEELNKYDNEMIYSTLIVGVAKEEQPPTEEIENPPGIPPGETPPPEDENPPGIPPGPTPPPEDENPPV